MGQAAEVSDPWTDDSEFQEVSIKSADGDADTGWSIERTDGWSFYVPADSPVEPKPEMVARFYGRGIGFPVRGLFIDGRCVYYRTEKEQDEHFKNELYGRDAADVLSRWDEGRCIWSIACGGFGPGYEQCIQISAMEVLRFLLGGGVIEEADEVLPSLEHLGLSGAQWGAGKMLANAFHVKGPHGINEDYPKDRHIQVSKFFPSHPNVYSDADALRDLQESILQSTTISDFMAVKKTVEAIREAGSD